MAHDRFNETTDSLIAPARRCSGVEPSDTLEQPTVSKAVYVGIGGDLVVRCVDDDADVTFADVQAGTLLPIRVSHVRSTGTTAQAIVVLA